MKTKGGKAFFELSLPFAEDIGLLYEIRSTLGFGIVRQEQTRKK
jgi:hypothetical protein